MEELSTVPEVEACPEPGPLADPDLVARYYRDVRGVSLLSREEEESLTLQISRHRSRLCALLRRHPRLVRRALATLGKGTIDPSRGFREQEAVHILEAARGEAKHPIKGRSLRAFIARFEKELAAYRSLRDRMLASNLRLVISLARRYNHPTLSQLDLIQEGTLGLLRAIERFEPQRGIRFGTYALWWIWHHLARAADNLGPMIRTPVHWNQFRRKLRRDARTADGWPTDNELQQFAAENGVPPEYARAMEQGVPCTSLDAPIDDDDTALAHVAAIDTDSDPAQLTETRDISAQMQAALADLPPRECEILRLRFGMSDDNSLTLEEIGRLYGVSRERIRQIEARAIDRMRAICRTRGLQMLLD
jgi:RNA polymerase primary sigma factor